MDKHLLSPCMTSIVYIYATGSMKIMFGITNAEPQARTHARTPTAYHCLYNKVSGLLKKHLFNNTTFSI